MPNRRSLIPGRDCPAPEYYAHPSMYSSYLGVRRPAGYRKSFKNRNPYDGYESGGENSHRIRQQYGLNRLRPQANRRVPGAYGYPTYGMAGAYRPYGGRGILGRGYGGAAYGGWAPPYSPYLRPQGPNLWHGFGPYAYGTRPILASNRFGHHAVRNRYQQPYSRGMGGGYGLGGLGTMSGMGGFRGLGGRQTPLARRHRSVLEDDDDYDDLGDDSSYLGTFNSHDRYGSSHPSSLCGGDLSEDDDYFSGDEVDDGIWDEFGSSFGRGWYGGLDRY